MQNNLFEQYLEEQYEKELSTMSKFGFPFNMWVATRTIEQLIDYGNKAMEELSNGMNLELTDK